MATTNQLIAKHLREVHTGGNWTAVSLQEQLKNLPWEQACQSLHGAHTIAELVFHMNYYVAAALVALQGGELSAEDEFSFDMPVVDSQASWSALVQRSLDDAEQVANLIERLDDSILPQDFVQAKHGNYYRNLGGLVEHCHYHLGQIVILRRMIDRTGNVS